MATPTPTPGQAAWVTGATVSRATLSRGSTENITATVKVDRAITAIVDVEVYGPNGQKVFQKYFDNATLAANTQRTFAASWAVPTGAARGTYMVRIGVFSPGWSQLYSWNNAAVPFVVN